VVLKTGDDRGVFDDALGMKESYRKSAHPQPERL
jgi:hypothetical protein